MTFDAKAAVYTPPETSKFGLEQIKWIEQNKHRSLKFPVAGIDNYFADLLPGQICPVIAQSSNFKSGFCHFWQHHAAKRLQEQARNNEILIHVSVEESIEEQAMLMFAMESGLDSGDIARGVIEDKNKMEYAALQVGTIPIYRVGHSLARADDLPNLYLSNIIRSLKFLMDELEPKKKVAGIWVDYLQALPFDPEHKIQGGDSQRRLQVKSDMFRLRYMASYFKCPVIIPVQSKQILRQYGDDLEKIIPDMYSGEESSSIAQRADKVITLAMPKMTYPLGYKVVHNDMSFNVEANQLLIKVAKQRGRLPSGDVFPCRINFATNEVVHDRDLWGYL